MNGLTTKEKDLLGRVAAKPELRARFFRKIKGFKWFDSLYQAGYFDDKNIPAPVPSKEEGYITVPNWEAIAYLVNVAQKFDKEDADEYAPLFLKIIENATNYAKDKGFSNYLVWRQFAEILIHIPIRFLTLEYLEVVDYWLKDKYEHGLVSEIIGSMWLPEIIEKADEPSLKISYRLLEILYEVVYVDENNAGRASKKAQLRFNYYTANKVKKKSACSIGRYLGKKGVMVFQSRLEEVFDKLQNDTWSTFWQPAVEEHEQNKHRRNTENILIEIYRDTLCSYINENSKEACEYLEDLLKSRYQTIVRVAIYCIGQNFDKYLVSADKIINVDFLQDKYRHEIWHFLHQNYNNFTKEQKNRVLAAIQSLDLSVDEGVLMNCATAYERATWLAAIKDLGKEEADSYQEAIRTAGAEPDHPDFTSFIGSLEDGQKSPYLVEELIAMSAADLVKTLNDYRAEGGPRESGIKGLSETVKRVFKNSPLKYSDNLDSFSGLDLAYVHSIIVAYSELWNEKANLPWEHLWNFLLNFVSKVIGKKRFWDPENAKQRDSFVANRYWIVSALARFLGAGVRSDDHALPAKFHDRVEASLQVLLEKEEGVEFSPDDDAVSVSINSPRGQCIEALIFLTLSDCRLEDRSNDGNHDKAWEHYCGYFNAELEREESSEKREYEFTTLVANYLPNFFYMSRHWVLKNLSRIFDQSNHLKWLCAMQGYSYVNRVDREIYGFLKEHGDFVRVLDIEDIKSNVEEEVIQHIVVGYIKDFESLGDEDSLIQIFLDRAVFEELSQLIWFIRTLQKEDDDKLTRKVYELWPKLLKFIDPSRKESRELASSLCTWAVFVKELDSESMNLLRPIAPFAEEFYNSYDLLENLARISEEQPFEANEVWQAMLQGCVPDYPEEAIRKLLTNLLSKGPDGKRAAKDTVSLYFKKGSESPLKWLDDIINYSKN